MLKEKLIITDVGSTTTKAIYLKMEANEYKLQGLTNAITTVESPYEDVNIGVYQAIKALENASNELFLSPEANEHKLIFLPNVSYLTSSSAGGGLQILVVGLTLFDSAKSAERAAYGAGGVLLNTLAINDKRTTYEQMQIINNSHPDIILFSGGTDYGAYTGVIRMAEVLAFGKPSPKFATEKNIPLIYAGNVQAQSFMKSLFSDDFALTVLPNIRPSMEREELDEITEKIHELFLNSVMEDAPGYAQLKVQVDGDILPTPLAVLKMMEILSEEFNESMLKVDIGGATTDIFSVINGSLYRTVSANYGMSYSISNVIANAGYEELKKLLPPSFSEKLVRDYIGNKMLNPGYVPDNEIEIAIEQAIAIIALRLSLLQHYDMHLNTSKIGFLEHVKSVFRDPFYDQMYQEKVAEENKFHHSDIKIVIGAGGVISHVDKPLQALYILMQGFQVEGITHIWRDKHFISPHLGVLSQLDKMQVKKLMFSECYEKLGTVINPLITSKKTVRKVMTIEVGKQVYNFNINQVKLIKIDKNTLVKVKLHSGALIKDLDKDYTFETDKAIIITTYPNKEIDNMHLIKELELYKNDLNIPLAELESQRKYTSGGPYFHKTGPFIKEINLPYEGEILCHENDILKPNTVYGFNNHAFPKLYIVSLAKLLGKAYKNTNIARDLLVKVGDLVKFDQKLIGRAHSPVRGIVKVINYKSGSIVIREHQDYHERAIIHPVAKMLNMKVWKARSRIKVKEGEFVFQDQCLVNLNMDHDPIVVRAKNTGYVTKIDNETAEVTIQYKKHPINYHAKLNCKVLQVNDKIGVKIQYDAIEYQGIIGFGSITFGDLVFLNKLQEDTDISGKILVLADIINYEDLKKLENLKISGLIIAGIEMKDLVEFIGREIGVALTGNESIPYSIIIMNGFGKFSFDPEFIKTVKKNEGRNCLLNPTTQVRAGVTRPKVIIN